MGLLKAAFGAAGGVMADQWKEYFYCESIEPDVLVVKGRKRTSEKRSSNVHERPRMAAGLLRHLKDRRSGRAAQLPLHG